MEEKIIFASGVNESEFLRTLAKNGINTIGVRVLNAVELAELYLIRCGISITEDFLPRNEEASVISSFISSVSYFSTNSYKDCENLANSIYTLRNYIPENEDEFLTNIFSKGKFGVKNQAIIDVIKKYKDYLSNTRIDSIGLIRKAINSGLKQIGEVIILKEYEPTPIEKKLLNTICTNIKEMTLTELFGKEEKDVHIESYKKAYGANNEIEDILGYIYKNNIPLDKCEIVLPEINAYTQILYDYFQTYNISATFGCGLPLLNSNPAKILKLLYDWNTKGFNGIDALRTLLDCSAFNYEKLAKKIDIDLNNRTKKEIIKKAGDLKISFSDNSAKIKECIESLDNEEEIELFKKVALLSKEIEKGYVYLITEYSVIRKDYAGRVDRSALNVIATAINAYLKHNESGNGLNEIIETIFSKTVCSENCAEGFLHVTSINNAISSLREHVFVVGLSASIYPGNPKENYLLLDTDFSLIDCENVPDSQRIIENKKEQLMNLILFGTNIGCKIYLSYPYFDTSELKLQNPSSLLYDIYNIDTNPNSKKDFDKVFESVEFFGKNSISNNKVIGEEYVKNINLLSNNLVKKDIEKVEIKYGEGEDCFSPSRLSDFFSCGYRYFLKHVLYVDEPEQNDPFQILGFDELGILFHAQMEKIDSYWDNKTGFIKAAEDAFNKTISQKTIYNLQSIEIERNKFIEIISNTFELLDKNNIKESIEEDINITEEERAKLNFPIKIHGKADRIEKSKDGKTVYIIDYKTKNKIEHIENDVDTCLQTLVYAAIYESKLKDKKDIKIECRFIYPKLKTIIKCEYSKENKEKLFERLDTFKKSLDNNEFNYSECDIKEEPCKYCGYKNICKKYLGKVKETEEE